MRFATALLVLLVAGSGTAFAQAPERSYPRAGYPPYGFRVFTDRQPSILRLEISPADAQVFVDRHYVGAVSQFNGMSNGLTLHAGPHLVEIRRSGFLSTALEVTLFPAQRVTLSRAMLPCPDDSNSASQADILAPSFEEGAFLTAAAPDAASGELRLDVTPKNAEVYADGFYVGLVDDFNGRQHMMLTQGPHHLTLKREGYETLDLNLSIDSRRTVTYRAAMNKAGALSAAERVGASDQQTIEVGATRSH